MKNQNIIVICSLVASADAVGDGVLQIMLKGNAGRRNDVWCMVGESLALRVLEPLDVSPEVFRSHIGSLAEDADAAEKELSSKDEF